MDNSGLGIHRSRVFDSHLLLMVCLCQNAQIVDPYQCQEYMQTQSVQDQEQNYSPIEKYLLLPIYLSFD
jgi:hypothetical protein